MTRYWPLARAVSSYLFKPWLYGVFGAIVLWGYTQDHQWARTYWAAGLCAIWFGFWMLVGVIHLAKLIPRRRFKRNRLGPARNRLKLEHKRRLRALKREAKEIGVTL